LRKSQLNNDREMVTIKVNFEYNGSIISAIFITGEIGLIIDITHRVPEGFVLADGQSAHFVLHPVLTKGVVIKLVDLKVKPSNKNNSNIKRVAPGTIIENKIHFMTKTEHEICRGTIRGPEKSKVRIQCPPGYRFTSDYWNFAIVSADNPHQKVYVVPLQNQKSPRRTETLDSIFDHRTSLSGFFMTYSSNGIIPVFNGQGLTIYNMANNYDLKVSHCADLHGTTYLEIARDVWVNAQDVIQYQPLECRVEANEATDIRLFDCQGRVTSRGILTDQNIWYTDRKININGTTLYRVTETGWLSSRDVHELKKADSD
jgi:hypothetical protein